jgi:anti-anti-sigma regulatory factor
MTSTELRRVAVDGELTIMTAAEQLDRLLGALRGSNGLRVDLSGVEDLDTAGLQVLLVARREADRLHLPFELGAPGELVAASLAIAGLGVAEES